MIGIPGYPRMPVCRQNICILDVTPSVMMISFVSNVGNVSRKSREDLGVASGLPVCEVEVPCIFCIRIYIGQRLSTHFPDESCFAVGGPGKGMACVFPFTFMGVTYEKCDYYLGQPTCATMVDDHGTAINYGYCGPNCPING